MFKSHRLASAVALAAALSVVAGIAAAATPARRGAAQKPRPTPTVKLRIGDVMSFTGDLSPYGPSLDAAAHLAATQITKTLAQMHLSKKISIRIVASEDDQTKIQPAVEAATKLVKVNKINTLIGTISSGSTIAVAQSVTIPNGILHITPTSSSPAITGLKDNGLVFRILPSDTFQARELVSVLKTQLGKKAKINLGYRNDDWGNALSALFTREWKASGGRIGTSVSWNPDAPNFDTEAQKLAGGNPTGWVILDFPPTFAKMAPSLVRAGGWSPQKTFVTAEMRNADAISKLGNPATEGLRGVAPTSGKSAARDALDKLFKSQVPGKPLTGFEGTAFDAVYVAFLSALDARSVKGNVAKKHVHKVTSPKGKKYTFLQLKQAIRAILAGKDIDFDGVTGPLDINAAGDPQGGKFELWKVVNGQPQTQKIYSVSG